MAKDDGLRQVKNTFSTMYKGLEVTYLEGEVVHPDDPLLKKLPQHFGPLEFPHDPAAFKAAQPRQATAAEEKAIAATVKAEAEPDAEPEAKPEPEVEPEAEAEPEPKPLTTAAFRGGRRGTLQAPEIRS